jgi:hypothetical protein
MNTMQTKNAEVMIELAIRDNPYAVIFNTGAWDYDHLARFGKGKKHLEESCHSPETEQISKDRASNTNKQIFHEMGKLANEHNVKVVYRNNHLNGRFGALCADERFEDEVLAGSGWFIWDNRRISKGTYQEQNYDGFHFDRHRVHTYAHHVGHMKHWKTKGWELPGMLEITLAQSLLFTLFRDEVEYFVNNNIPIHNEYVVVSDGFN